jgi:hypothetical protein
VRSGPSCRNPCKKLELVPIRALVLNPRPGCSRSSESGPQRLFQKGILFTLSPPFTLSLFQELSSQAELW